MEIFPETKKIYVISGYGIIDESLLKRFNNETASLQSVVEFEYLSKSSLENLSNKLKNLPENSLVYYLTYTVDSLGRSTHAHEISWSLSESSNRPIFTFLDIIVNRGGVFGGKVTSVQSLAVFIAQASKRVLTNEEISPMPQLIFAQKFVYNWQALRRWNKSPDDLPPGHLILNKPISIIEAYKWQILGGVFLLLFQSVLIIVLLNNVIRRKKAEIRLKEYQSELEKLVTERTISLEQTLAELGKSQNLLQNVFEHVGSVMFVKMLDHEQTLRYKIANQKFLEDFNLSSEQVIGHTDSDIFPRRLLPVLKNTTGGLSQAGCLKWWKSPANWGMTKHVII